LRGLEAGAQTALRHTYDHLLMPALGENPYGDKDDGKNVNEPE
jgi:hypothetical protein